MVAGVFTGVWLSHLVLLRVEPLEFKLASDTSWSTLRRFAGVGVSFGSGLSVLNSFSKQSFARMLVNSVMVRDACMCP